MGRPGTRPSARRPARWPDPRSRLSVTTAGDGTPARTIFLGSGGFAVPILEALIAAPEVVLVAVVTAPDRAAGRHGRLHSTPIAARAAELGLPVLTPAWIRDAAVIASIAALQPALGVLADYGRIVPQALLDVPLHGILNVHPSLLPRHRGATPIPAAILAADPVTGVTVIQMDAGLDTGPIVAAESWLLSGSETAPIIEAQAAAVGARIIRALLAGWLAGQLPAQPQDERAATLTRPLGREDGRLDPARPALELERAVRAYLPWPGTFLDTPRGRLAVRAATVEPAAPGDVAGSVVEDDLGLALVTVADRLRLLEVQPAGGRSMSAAAYLRGRVGRAGLDGWSLADA